MYESIASQLMSCTDDQVSTSNEVVVADKVSCAADLRKVLMGLTSDAKDVRSSLFDLTESFCRTRNCLVYDDGFHIRIIRKVHDGLNRGLQLFCEVVRVDRKSNAVLAIHSLKGFCTTAVIFRLGYRSCYDTDMVITCCF